MVVHAHLGTRARVGLGVLVVVLVVGLGVRDRVSVTRGLVAGLNEGPTLGHGSVIVRAREGSGSVGRDRGRVADVVSVGLLTHESAWLPYFGAGRGAHGQSHHDQGKDPLAHRFVVVRHLASRIRGASSLLSGVAMFSGLSDSVVLLYDRRSPPAPR